jgi:peptidoglycan/xylan/chitin deacetylase (PgdA/CDA1 family)
VRTARAGAATRGGAALRTSCLMRTLTYHDITSRDEREEFGFPGPLAARYKLEPEDFEAHLDAIASDGLRVGVPGADPQAQVVLSFDDGGASAMRAAEALERRGWRGQFFITTSRLDTPGFLSTEEVRELARRGHGVGSHSHSHPTYMGRLTRAELDREWERSRELLHGVLGSPPAIASVPGGYMSKGVASAAAAAGYELLFTSEPTARVARLELPVRGRYTIWSTTPAQTAAAYARGAPIACGRLWLEWNAKKLAKRASPAIYQSLRRVRARRI